MAYATATRQLGWIGIALGTAGIVTAVIWAGQLSVAKRRRQLPGRDYSDRSGLPMGIEQSRGIARDAGMTDEFRIPQALRPFEALA